jgi:hypothetical protein
MGHATRTLSTSDVAMSVRIVLTLDGQEGISNAIFERRSQLIISACGTRSNFPGELNCWDRRITHQRSTVQSVFLVSPGAHAFTLLGKFILFCPWSYTPLTDAFEILLATEMKILFKYGFAHTRIINRLTMQSLCHYKY